MPADTKSFDDIFNEHLSELPGEVEEEVVEQTPEEKVEETEEEVEQEEVQSEEEEEENYEEEIPDKKKAEPVDEDEPKNESHARKRAKEEGQRRKQLEAEKKEWEIERDRLSKELEESKSKLNEFETTRIKPEDHDDYKALVNEILTEVRDEVEGFDAPGAKSLLKIGDYTQKYRVVDKATDRDDQLAAFKTQLAKDLFEDREFEELDKDERKEVTAALKLIKKATSKADKLTELHNDLEKRSKNGTLAVGLREYETTTKEYQPILDSIGDLPDDVVEENPTTLESVVARIAKSSPDGKKRVENAKRDVVEILFGQRPLTQAEIDKYEANGGSYKELLASRQKSLNEKRKKLLPMLVQGLVGRSEFKKALAELAELKTKKESEESEDDALQKITKKKVKVTAPEKKSKTVNDIFKEYDLDD